MGYYVDTESINARIPKANLEKAVKRLKELNKSDRYKRGFTSIGGKRTYNFSWMPSNYDETTHTAKEILDLLGFETEYNSYGDLDVQGYHDKSGNEGVFIWSIADLFEPDSHINWVGEDGDKWRWEFGGGEEMVQLETVTTYVNPHPYAPFAWNNENGNRIWDAEN